MQRAAGANRLFTVFEVEIIKSNCAVRLPHDPDRVGILPAPVLILEPQRVEINVLIRLQRHAPGKARPPVWAVGDREFDLRLPVAVPPVECCRAGRQGVALNAVEGGGQGRPRIRRQVFALERDACRFTPKVAIGPVFEMQLALGAQGVERPADRAGETAVGLGRRAGLWPERGQVLEDELIVGLQFPPLRQGARGRELHGHTVDAQFIEADG